MYLDLDAIESPDSAMQKPIISDDGERINELLGSAGGKMLGAAKRVAEQERLLAAKSSTRIHEAVTGEIEFHYLDAEKNPKGPVTRTDLDRLYQFGEITDETHVLSSGGKAWLKYRDLLKSQAAM